VPVEEFAAAILQPCLFPEQLVLNLTSFADAGFEFVAEVVLDVSPERRGEGDGLVVVNDLVLDERETAVPCLRRTAFDSASTGRSRRLTSWHTKPDISDTGSSCQRN
jgi:hypothetical protein